MIGGGAGQAGQGFFQPAPGIDAELWAGRHEAGEDRQAAAAVVAAEEQPDGMTVSGWTPRGGLPWGSAPNPGIF